MASLRLRVRLLHVGPSFVSFVPHSVGIGFTDLAVQVSELAAVPRCPTSDKQQFQIAIII